MVRCLEKRAGVGVALLAQHVAGRALFDDLALVHHRHLVGHVSDHGKIMGDEQQRHVLFLHQPAQQIEDLRLRGHIERGGGFIGDQQPGAERNGGGDANPLALATRQLMRVAVQRNLRQAHAVQFLACHVKSIGTAGRPVDAQGFGDLVADGAHRVEGRHRFLEDHAKLVAAQGAHLGLWPIEQVDPVKTGSATRARPVGQQLHQRKCRHRLARSAFADQSEGLARLHGKIHIPQDRRAMDIERQAVHLDHCRTLLSLGSSMSRSPSPIRFSPRTISTMASPGSTASIG